MKENVNTEEMKEAARAGYTGQQAHLCPSAPPYYILFDHPAIRQGYFSIRHGYFPIRDGYFSIRYGYW